MAEQAIVFKDVSKAYGRFVALDHLSFTVQEGELYGLIGPNGAGKTTSMRLLIGLQQMGSGSIRILGYRPPAIELHPLIGYMPQDTSLYLDLTVRENLDLFGKLYTINRAELRRRIDELLHFTDLSDWADSTVINLSGGMRHRTSLAVALLPKPKLLVLDEPTVGVDPELRASFWQRFAEMRKQGTTILITTHYMDEAMQCERVGLITHGKLIAEGSPSRLIEQAKALSLEDAFLKLAGHSKECNQ